jgi:acyl-CoA synthetase (AMP-forming)/AMP-acid ligase II
MLFTAVDVGRKTQLPLLTKLVSVVEQGSSSLPDLKKIIIIRGENPFPGTFTTYDDLLREASLPHTLQIVNDLTTSINSHSICNFQFTSGTTGAPKATTLTHHNVINNGLLIGHVMRLQPGTDIICCPPPLYHAFGLVLGLLACYTHGVAIVFPSWNFDPGAVLNSIVKERCTGLLGVPTMLVAVLQEYRLGKGKDQWGKIVLRTGIAAGSPVPRYLMEQLQEAFGLPELVIIYGMTELAGASFSTSVDDGMEEKLSSVGKVIPHTRAKVIGPDGAIVPCGLRGELCMAGFGVQKGYYQNPEKTDELMRRDAEGVLWVHSGDEATLDGRGYCRITGRIKDMIIRGGENIYPFEIEQRLGLHPSVVQSSVVGLKDEHYGEVVAAFLERRAGAVKPGLEELQEFVRKTLGRYNVPVHVFWVGAGEDVEDFPKTSSGKIKKLDLRTIGNSLIEKS